MSITESVLNGMLHDLSVIQHLYTKLDPEKANWRPQENMRTTLELLQYLVNVGQSTVRQLINPLRGDEAMAPIIAGAQKAKLLTFEQIPAAIEEEKEAIKAAFAGITDADLTRPTWQAFGGPDTTLGDALINSVPKYLTAYRHQLFIYAKLCGADINTRNNWAGMDTPRPADVPAATADNAETA